MKNLYIIPGYGETHKMRKYQKIKLVAKKLGYNPIIIPVDWEAKRSICVCVRAVVKETARYGDMAQSTILGFSFGACILALLLEKICFKKAIFCSVSPYFKEDISLWPPKIMKEIQKEIGSDPFVKSLAKETFPASSKQTAVFLVGSKEGDICIGRAKRSYTLWDGKKKLHIIPGAIHNVGNKHYLKSIEKVLE